MEFGSRINSLSRYRKYLFVYFIPTTMFTVTSWVSYLLPPTSYPARTSLLVTVFLCQVWLNILPNALEGKEGAEPELLKNIISGRILRHAARSGYSRLPSRTRLTMMEVSKSIFIKATVCPFISESVIMTKITLMVQFSLLRYDLPGAVVLRLHHLHLRGTDELRHYPNPDGVHAAVQQERHQVHHHD